MQARRRGSSSEITTLPQAPARSVLGGQRSSGHSHGGDRAHSRRGGHLETERGGGGAHAPPSGAVSWWRVAARGEGGAGRREEEALGEGVEEWDQRAAAGMLGVHRGQEERRRRADGRDHAGHHEVPARLIRDSANLKASPKLHVT